MGRGNSDGGSAVTSAKTAEPIEMLFAWVVGSDEPKESCVRWESRSTEGCCHDNQFWDAICYNWFLGDRL